MKFIKNHKILLIIIAIVLIIAIALGIYFCTKDTSTEVNSLKVTYKDGDQISIKNPSTPYEITKEITVTNPTKELKTYSLEWLKVSNTFKEQNKLLYTIKGSGDRSASLGKSQVPSASSKIFNSVAITAGTTHKYTITITYNGGKTSNDSFLGTLIINSEKPKKDTKTENGIPYKDKSKNKNQTKQETKKETSKQA